MKKPLWSLKLANWTCGLLAVGTFVFWLAGFLTHYAPLYTLYWPLPADFAQFSLLGGIFFIVGIALAMVGTAFFVVNIYATIAYTPAGWEKQPAGGPPRRRPRHHRGEELLRPPEDGASRLAAGGRDSPGHGRHGAECRRHSFHRRSHSRLHGGGPDGDRPEALAPSMPCSTRTGSGGGWTSSQTAWSSSSLLGRGICWPCSSPARSSSWRTSRAPRSSSRWSSPGPCGRTISCPIRLSPGC